MAYEQADVERLGNLYFVSGTFDPHPRLITAHQLNPDAPLSPYYMHFPESGEPGYLLLPQIITLTGKLMAGIIEEEAATGHLFAGLPDGATPLARATASHFDPTGLNVLTFSKEKLATTTLFHHKTGHALAGEPIVPIDDHTSVGRNAGLFTSMLQNDMNLRVKLFLNIVDREQGGRQALARLGVKMRSIFLASVLIRQGLEEGHLSQDKFDEIDAYITANRVADD